MSSNKYIKFVDLSLETVQSSRLNLYSCKYSKHVYTQHQLLVLVLLKEYISTDYRDFVELIELMNDIKEKLDLDKIPHYTTLQKFVSRIPSLLFNLILSKVLKLFYSHGEIVSITAIDATGFTSSYASYYYSRRTGKLRRSFLKTSIAVDTDKKVILGWKISQKTDHDVKHANTLIRQSNRTRKSECYVMDKGYDSEKIHALVREKIKADSIIPLRERKRKKVKGKYRKKLHLSFDKIKYNRRNIVETTFSVVKRKFGEVLRARKYFNQVKEIKLKLLVYNINKKVVEIICIKLRISTEPK
ncbi:IS5 family transposase [Methanosarcina sp. DH2]|uniref:IS5 family transposase n=1 Tax=Methanosarcina sp. DH2 TaxID=2605639 RepID=UPI001E412478|nr:IS5 family transposase [Methanosarcina sp. DH2]MCC4769868.1 IS5 family transposase [Methanosarcina sp. DH2]